MVRAGERRNTCRFFERWEDNIKMDLGSWAWTGLIWLRTGENGEML